QLQAGIQALGDLRNAPQAGVLQNQNAPLGLLGRDERPGFHQQRADLVVTPQRRNARRPRLRSDELRQCFPKRARVFLFQPFVKLPAPGGRFGRGDERCRVIHRYPWPSAARTVTSIAPIFSMEATMTSPGLIGLTPSGVPVMITSPGYKV